MLDLLVTVTTVVVVIVVVVTVANMMTIIANGFCDYHIKNEVAAHSSPQKLGLLSERFRQCRPRKFLRRNNKELTTH